MINQINAEMLLNYLYPELQDEWVVQCRGTFYRNYNADTLSVDAKNKKVKLARDGILKLLPPEFISPEKETEKDEQLRRRIAMLTEAFVPIDSIMFHNSLKIEKSFAGLLERKTSIALSKIFGIDYDSICNPLVKDAALLLPYVRESRGDVQWVKKLLEVVTSCPVELKMGRWSETDNTKFWLPLVHFFVVCDGLTGKDYLREMENIRELQDFVMEHWMPAETVLKIDLITHKVESDKMILNYSTELK